MGGRRFVLGARSAFALIGVLSAVYCFLAYVPFTYQQLIVARLFTWPIFFARIHPYLYAASVFPLAMTLAENRRRPETATLTAAFLVFQAILIPVLIATRPLEALGNDRGSFFAALLALLPLAWLAAIDLVAGLRRERWEEPQPGRAWPAFLAAAGSAVFVTLLYSLLFSLRTRALPPPGFRIEERLLGLGWSLVFHLLAFLAFFVVLDLVSSVARLFRVPARAEFLLCAGLAAVGLIAALRRIVLAALSFVGPESDVFSVALGATIAAVVAGSALRIHADRGASARSGLEILLGPLSPSPSASRALRGAWLAGVAGLGILLAEGAGSMDWNFMLQKLAVGTIWVLAFAFFYSGAKLKQQDRSLLLLFLATLPLGARHLLEASRPRLQELAKSDLNVDLALDRYAAYDVSFQMLREALSPPRGGGGFYQFLQRNTNISRAVHIELPTVDLVKELQPAQGQRPNIFVLVIDSLRRDHLSPYDAAVGFTPEIEEFAKGSVVFKNAFTRYGATGLSEPSIWAGGMLVHQQYPGDFHRIDTLEKLVEADGYRRYVSVDTILRQLLKPADALIEIDAGTQNRDHDLCASLKDLEAKLVEHGDDPRPIFAYTQPQNIHVAQIHREGNKALDNEEYGAFHAPYASRIRRMDACFGEFTDFLKQRGLWDTSIVILTADHGDSLGEEGRWGHAYTVYPEVVRVPLIVHLPADATVTCDVDELAFTTDLSPTLYYLLGHRPVVPQRLFGRPLCSETPAERRGYPRGGELVASSYGAVYGILDDGGRSLYIADAVGFQDSFWDLSGKTAARAPVSAPTRERYQRMIQDRVVEIGRFYGLGFVAAQ